MPGLFSVVSAIQTRAHIASGSALFMTPDRVKMQVTEDQGG